MMENQLIISNFRSWKDKNYIDLASINLLLGPNSSGKSSIIHALSLLKQSEISLRLIPKGDEIDLGSIETQVNFKTKNKPKRDINDFIGFGLNYKIKSTDLLTSYMGRGTDRSGMMRRSRRQEGFEEKSNILAALIGHIEYLERFDDLGFIKDITLSSGKLEILTIYVKRKGRSSKVSITIKITDDPSFWTQFIDFSGKTEEFNRLDNDQNLQDEHRLERFKFERDHVYERLDNNEKEIEDLLHIENVIKKTGEIPSIETGSKVLTFISDLQSRTKKPSAMIVRISKTISQLRRQNTQLNSQANFLRRRIEEIDNIEIKSIPGGTIEEKCVYISEQLGIEYDLPIEDLNNEGIVSSLNYTLQFRRRNINAPKMTSSGDKSDLSKAQAALDLLDANSKNNLNINPFLMLSIANRQFQELTSSVFRIGPHRKRPDRITFVNPNEKKTFVGSQGENVTSIINQSSKKEITAINNFLKILEIPYSLEPKFNSVYNISELILSDHDGLKVSLADVGYGISQVLPILLESMTKKNTLIIIEQPELHLHPKLQANLASLFIDSAEMNNNNFILETHSEHIILRMKRLQKEARQKVIMGKNNKEKIAGLREHHSNRILAEWVSIRDSVVISVIDTPKNKSESEFTKITLNSDGDFDNVWPGEFFPERYIELGLEDDI